MRRITKLNDIHTVIVEILWIDMYGISVESFTNKHVCSPKQFRHDEKRWVGLGEKYPEIWTVGRLSRARRSTVKHHGSTINPLPLSSTRSLAFTHPRFTQI